MDPYSLGIRVYNWFETFAHDSFRKKFARIYSTSQLNAAKRNYPNWQTLTKEQKNEIVAYWGIPHPVVASDFMTHEIMLNVKGEFDVRYVPEKIYRLYLDPGLADRKLILAWDDKNYFERHQPGLPFPHTYVRNVNGWFLDNDYRHISPEDARKIMVEHLPLIVKPSLVSGEGKNLRMVSDEKAVDEVLSTYPKNYLAQEVIAQCDEFNRMNSHSVAVMRIVTAIVNGKAELMSSMLLTNTTDVVACNRNTAPGVGVVCIGIDDEGKLADTGYFENAKPIRTLPNGFTFGGLQVPSYKEAVALALNAHESMPMLGIIGWDITIDKNNKPIIIEWNLRGIGMYHSQLTTGPLFGQYSDYFAEIAKKMIDG